MHVWNGRTARHGVVLAAAISLLSSSAASQPSESERRRKYMEKERQRTTAIQDNARRERLEQRKRAREEASRARYRTTDRVDQNRVLRGRPIQSWQSKACDRFFWFIRTGSGHSYKVLRTALDARGALPPNMAKKWPGFKLEWRLSWYADTCRFDARQRHLTQTILRDGPSFDDSSYRPPSSSRGSATRSGSKPHNGVSPEVRANWRQYIRSGKHKLPTETEAEKRKRRKEAAAGEARQRQRLQKDMAPFRGQLPGRQPVDRSVQSQKTYDRLRQHQPRLFRMLRRNRPPARLSPLSPDLVPRGQRSYRASEPEVRSHPLALKKSAGLKLSRSDEGPTTTEFSLTKRGWRVLRRVVKIDEQTRRVRSVADSVYRVNPRKHSSIGYGTVVYTYSPTGELVGPK